MPDQTPTTTDEKVDKLLHDVTEIRTDQRWMKWALAVLAGVNLPALAGAETPIGSIMKFLGF